MRPGVYSARLGGMKQDMTLSELLSAGAVLISLSGVAFTYFAMIARIQNRLTALEVKMAVFWSAVEKVVPAMLHSPHTPDRDALLEKFAAKTITHDEAERLLQDLTCCIFEFPEDKRLAVCLGIGMLQNWLLDRGDCYHVPH